MKPQLGWVWLSQAEREGAEAALSAGLVEGARDELGFGSIHFAYADRFFPGTSVLHTKLRYVFVVCWAYQEAMERYPGAAFPKDRLNAIQDRVGHRLLQRYGAGDNTGIIGVRILSNNESPRTKPSDIYWNAVRTWGLLQSDPPRAAPSQSVVQRRWQDYTVLRNVPEVDGRREKLELFDALPIRPGDWFEDGPISFDITPAEAGRIRRGWERANGGGSLMSRLAALGGEPPELLNSAQARSVCDAKERASLALAEQAGALVAIGRALYGAMVEDLKRDDPGGSTGQGGSYLKRAHDIHGETAKDLDIEALALDVAMGRDLQTFLMKIQDWSSRGGSYAGLRPAFLARESDLKNARALLLPDNVKRRKEWNLPLPYPLTYRWDRVQSFLRELSVA